jgi:hypothetical protein
VGTAGPPPTRWRAGTVCRPVPQCYTIHSSSCQALLTTNQPSNSVTVMLYMYKSSTLKLINRQSGGIHLLLRNGVIEGCGITLPALDWVSKIQFQ